MTEGVAEIQQLIEELNQLGPGGSVELLLRQLDPDDAHQLRLCAIPHEFDAAIIRALAPEIDKVEARRRCETFSKFSVVERCGEAMALHDEPRRHLFQEWLAASRSHEFRTASGRLVQHFDGALQALEQSGASAVTEDAEDLARRRMFHRLGAARAEGLAEFEHLCRARRAELRYSDCETLIKLVHEYDAVLTPLEKAIVAYHEAKLATDRHKWDRAEELFQQVLSTAGVPLQLRVKTHCRIGMVKDEQRLWREAIATFEQGLQLANGSAECRDQVVHLHLNSGSALRDAGDLEQAEAALNRGLELAKAAGLRSSVADAYNSLGTLYLRQTDNRRAIAAYEKSLAYLDEARDRFRRAQVYNNLGNAHADEREWEKSAAYYRQSLEIKRAGNDLSGEAATLVNLVRVYRAQRQEQQAIDASDEAIRLFRQVHDNFNVAQAQESLAVIYRTLGRTAEARAAFEDAAKSFTAAKAQPEAAAARVQAAEVERRTSLPWWIWLALVFVLVFAALIVLALLGY